MSVAGSTMESDAGEGTMGIMSVDAVMVVVVVVVVVVVEGKDWTRDQASVWVWFSGQGSRA